MTDRYKIFSLHKCKLHLWKDPNQVVRIEARKNSNGYHQEYFVVALGDAAGMGAWVSHEKLIPCSPLEILAIQFN